PPVFVAAGPAPSVAAEGQPRPGLQFPRAAPQFRFGQVPEPAGAPPPCAPKGRCIAAQRIIIGPHGPAPGACPVEAVAVPGILPPAWACRRPQPPAIGCAGGPAAAAPS